MAARDASGPFFMLTALLFAALVDGAGEPAFDDAALCRDLTAFVATAAEDEPFASLVEPTGGRFGPNVTTRPLAYFRACTRYRYDGGWTINCNAAARRPLVEAQPMLAKTVGGCLGVFATPLPPGGFGVPVTAFQGEDWRVIVETRSCDRCKGMPEVVIRIVASRRD